MRYLYVSVVVFAAFAAFALPASAQGGWRGWNIHLLDGTTLEANPLGMNEAGRFTRGMGEQPGIERSKISYLSIGRRELPPLPEGVFKEDMVVMLDGTYTLGAVKFRDLKFSEGTILQNGKEISTENIAYIKFAQPKKKKTTQKRST